MTWNQKLALLFLCAVTFFTWGTSMVAFGVFPYRILQPHIDEMAAWLEGVGEGEQLTLGEKIAADFFGKDTRHTGRVVTVKKLKLDLRPVRDPQGLLKDSPQAPSYFSRVEDGYFVFYTMLNMPDAKFGALIVSGQGELVQVIPVPGSQVETGQGAVTEDGNFVFTTDGKLLVTDACGGTRYSQAEPGDNFHHRASGYDDTVWVWNADEGQLFDIESGRVIKRFSLTELIGANEDTAVLEARLIKMNMEGKYSRWQYSDLRENPDIPLNLISLEDPFHHNDIDVLSPKMAPYFPDFKVGDLLLSFRSINLITAIDQDTLKIKWFSYGEFSRQHDPDWGHNGEIIVYDNRSHSTHSRIISIDVETKRPRVLVAGEDFSFFQYAGGNQDPHPDGRILFTNSPEALQVDADNEVTFYFQNRHEETKQAAWITTVHYVPEEEFRSWVDACQG